MTTQVSAPRIIIDVRRNDGEVTRLQGAAGLAVATTFRRDDPPGDVLKDPPPVSLRCDTQLQMVVILASVIASVEAVAPGVTVKALELSRFLNGHEPAARRVLP